MAELRRVAVRTCIGSRAARSRSGGCLRNPAKMRPNRPVEPSTSAPKILKLRCRMAVNRRTAPKTHAAVVMFCGMPDSSPGPESYIVSTTVSRCSPYTRRMAAEPSPRIHRLRMAQSWVAAYFDGANRRTNSTSERTGMPDGPLAIQGLASSIQATPAMSR